jgi:hypothetical protein
MATFVITNLTASTVLLGDFYLTVPANGSVAIDNRAPSELDKMSALKALVLSNTVSVQVSMSAADIAAGWATPPQSVEPSDIAPVGSADIAAATVLFRQAFTAAAGLGAPDDITVFAAGSLPFKCRIVDAWAFVATPINPSTIDARTQANGGGTLLASFNTGVAGRVSLSAPNASVQVAPGSAVGLFLHRADNRVAGEVFLLVRREN